MTEHKHKFNLGFLNYNIETIFTDDIEASRSAYDDEVGHPSGDLSGVNGLHSCSKNSFTSYIFLKPDSEVHTIAHEAFHAVVRACKGFDIPLKNSSEEVYAYMLDFIINEILIVKETLPKPSLPVESGI